MPGWWLAGSAALGYLGSQANKSSAKANMAPFRLAKPYLANLYGSAQNLYRSNRGAPSWINDLYQSAAMGGGPFQGLSDTASGSFLNANPYLDTTFGNAAESVTNAYQKSVVPGIRSNFGLAGGYNRGSEAFALSDAQRNLGDSLGVLANNIYGGNYQSERDRMAQAQAQLAAGQLGAAQSFNDMNDPWRRLAGYSQAIGVQGPNPNATPAAYGNPWAGALGGGLYGYGVAQQRQQPSSTTTNNPTTVMV